MVVLIFTFLVKRETWNMTKTCMFEISKCHHAMPCHAMLCHAYLNAKNYTYHYLRHTYIHYAHQPLLTIHFIALLHLHTITGKTRRINRRHIQILGRTRQIRTRMVLTLHPRPKRFFHRWIHILVPQRKTQHMLQRR